MNNARTNDLHTRAHGFARRGYREPLSHLHAEIAPLIEELALEVGQLRRDLDRLRKAVHEDKAGCICGASKGGPIT